MFNFDKTKIITEYEILNEKLKEKEQELDELLLKTFNIEVSLEDLKKEAQLRKEIEEYKVEITKLRKDIKKIVYFRTSLFLIGITAFILFISLSNKCSKKIINKESNFIDFNSIYQKEECLTKVLK